MDTQGNYTTAYIDHGTAPLLGTYRYGILFLQGGATGTLDFANNLNSYFEVLQQNNMAHVVKFLQENIYNYVIFDPGSVFQSDVLITANKPSIIMTQLLNSGNILKISLTNPNLGLLADDEVYN